MRIEDLSDGESTDCIFRSTRTRVLEGGAIWLLVSACRLAVEVAA